MAVGAAVGGRVSCGGQACLLQMTKRRLWCRVTVAEWVAVRFAGCVNATFVSVERFHLFFFFLWISDLFDV